MCEGGCAKFSMRTFCCLLLQKCQLELSVEEAIHTQYNSATCMTDSLGVCDLNPIQYYLS